MAGGVPYLELQTLLGVHFIEHGPKFDSDRDLVLVDEIVSCNSPHQRGLPHARVAYHYHLEQGRIFMSLDVLFGWFQDPVRDLLDLVKLLAEHLGETVHSKI